MEGYAITLTILRMHIGAGVNQLIDHSFEAFSAAHTEPTGETGYHIGNVG